METIRIKVNPSVCSGCLSCVTTCSIHHESYVSLSAGRVQVILRPFEIRHKIDICRQCANHPCLEACPEGAIYRDELDIVRIDDARCNQCRLCMQACPFHAIFWNPVSEKVIKCDLCLGQPQCVEVCPTGALSLVSLVKEPRMAHPKTVE